MQEAFAQAAAAPQQGGSMLQFIIMMGVVFLIWNFLVINPQKKEREKHKAMMDSLAKNDEIITTSGIHGTIMNVKPNTFTLKIDDNVKIEIEKSAVSGLKKKREKTNGEEKKA